MAPLPSNMTRSSSSDSSALSNIMVAGTQEDESASEHVSASTPPTSLNDNGSLGSGKAAVDTMDVIEEEKSTRPKRARTGVSTYNLKSLSYTQESAGSSRNTSGLTGRTLVGDEDEDAALTKKEQNAVEMDWESTSGSPQRRSPRNIQRRPSVKDRVKQAATKVGSVLGKRRREMVEAGKRKLGVKDVQESPPQNKILKELDTGSKGVLDEIDLSDDEFDLPPPRPAKRARISEAVSAKQLTKPTAPPLKITSGRQMKKWQKEGLYVGQDVGMDPAHKGGRKKLQKQRPSSSDSVATESSDAPSTQRSFMSLPMFSYLDKARDFIIPFDIYAPSYKKGDEKPKDWTKLNKNRLVGDAKDLWERSEKLPASACVCAIPPHGEQGCGEDCLNRVMQYECNDDNCNLDASQCSNRAFAELAARVKKGGSFDAGVEVVKTANRGFGVRSCRTFTPGQIIMEYTGEVIDEGECQRRMREDYKDKQCYYLMELERGLIIDGTKGSMARFINHSCSPNCEVRMVKVHGSPRMAVFAGENGVMTGEELTYDYNFDNFGTTQQICYCGTPNCRGFLSKRLNAAEQKKLAREETERKRRAAEEAQKHAAAEARRKQVKTDRGSSWRGWVAVDDPETKERLKQEKKEKEEAEKSSDRAKRMAARRVSLPASRSRDNEATVKKTDSKRRKTVHMDEETTNPESKEEDEETTAGASVTETTNRQRHFRTVSTGSKFTEELSRPSSAQTHTSTIVKTTEVSVSTTEVHQEMRLLNNDFALPVAEEDAPKNEKHGLSRTASKGKEVVKSVGQTFKRTLKGIEKGTGSDGSGKLKQSTLSFAKLT